VCFNRFYQPDLDPDTREVMPCVDLSEPWELRLPLRWIAILRPLLPEISLAATTGISTGRDVEEADAALVMQISTSVEIPVAVKISPYYSSLAHTALSFADAGAAGLVCFNRFYQPDLDPDTREVMPCVDLSEPWELRLPLRWIAILRPLLPETSLAATTGISTGRDVAKALLVGADVAMMTSALLRHGPEYVARVESELREWATEHEYDSVDQLRGSVSHATTDNPAAFERANYMKVLQSYETPTMVRS